MTKEPKTPKVKKPPSGICPRCGRCLDDHNGWLTKQGPRCKGSK